MVKQLVQELVQEERPAIEDADTVLVDAVESDLATNDFFMKQPARGSSAMTISFMPPPWGIPAR